VEEVGMVTWLFTALIGAYMLGTAMRHVRAESNARGTDFPPLLTFSHPASAVLGLGCWLVYINGGPTGVGWAAFVLLIGAALLGDVLFLRWYRARKRLSDPDRQQLSEQQIPSIAVHTHGALAVVTIVLVLLSLITGTQ
jgi:manganese efflux pump family protein